MSAKLLILLAAWIGAFAPVLPGLFAAWLHHSDNSHGLLVPLVSAYYIWKKKEELKSAAITNSAGGAFLLAASLGLYLLSYAGGIAVLSRMAIVLALMGLLLYAYGRTVVRLLAFPLFFLFFMVPVPDSLLGLVSFPLQLLATQASTVILQALSLPAYREGNMLYFAQTELEVAEACSGIHSIMAYGMLSVLFAQTLKRGWSCRLILLFSALPLALLVNMVRVTGTGILADSFGPKMARGFLHEFSGLLVFALGFILLLGEYWLFQRKWGQAWRKEV